MTAAQSRTSPDRARKLAEQCFALARSTAFAGERDAAISRGIAIAERAGLSLDRFDIPGRAKASASAGDATPHYRSHRPTFDFDTADLEEILARAAQTRADWGKNAWYRQARDNAFAGMHRAAADAKVRPDETVYDARRRAFDEATAQAAARDRASGRRATDAPDRETLRRKDLRDRWPSIDAVLNALRARRVDVQTADNRTLGAKGDGNWWPETMLWVVQCPHFVVLDQWSLRELADEVCR